MDVASVRERLIKEMEEIYHCEIFFGQNLKTIPPGNPKEALMRWAAAAFNNMLQK